jgi:uncharacterized protein YhbP (UPF0306 family)
MRNADQATRIAAFLDGHRVMSLATCGPNGPHAANLFYVRDGFALLWVSDPASEHSMRLIERARVAATIAADRRDYARIKGLQIQGDAWRIVQPEECNSARSLLEARFTFLQQIRSGAAALRQAYDRAALYRLQPSRIVFIDNERGFGFKEAMDIDGGHSGVRRATSTSARWRRPTNS